MTDREKDSSRDGWMDDGGKMHFGISLCGIGTNMNGSMQPYSPQGQIPFPSSYSLRRGHTSILQVAVHQHHQGYWCELMTSFHSWGREREKWILGQPCAVWVWAWMVWLILHLVQKVVVVMANNNNTTYNDVRYHICNFKQHNSALCNCTITYARTTRKATIGARYKQYAYTTKKLQVNEAWG